MNAEFDAEALSRDAVERAFGAPEPQPLLPPLPAAPEFPVDALGEKLRRAVEAVRVLTQAPTAVAAHSVQGAASLAVQAHADVELPTGERNPTSLFLLVIAGSGERKTSTDKHSQRGVAARERELRDAYECDMLTYQNCIDAWEQARSEAKGRKVKGVEAKREALNQLGAPPQPPLTPLLTIDEPTLEGMTRLFRVGHSSLALNASEAATFLGGHGMKEDARVRMSGALTNLWDGTTLSRVRGNEAGVLAGRRLTVNLMAQPAVAALLLRDPVVAGSDGQGLVNRFLVAAPESTAGTRFFQEPPPEAEETINAFATRVRDLLAVPPVFREGSTNELAPRPLPLSPAARDRWIAYQHSIERQLVPGGDLEPIRGFATRLPAHACRLAAVQTLFASLEASEITEEAMANGIALAEYYAMEALRLTVMTAVSDELKLAALTLDWLQYKWTENLISVTDLCQRGPWRIRLADVARKIVAVLVKHGHLLPNGGSAYINGRTRREVWRIVGK